MANKNINYYLMWAAIILFGSSSLFGNNFFRINNQPLAYVGKKKICNVDIKKYLHKVPGYDSNDDEMRSQIQFQALNIAISNSLITQEAKRLGFVVSYEAIVENIQNDKKFSVAGSFSRPKFISYLNNNDLTESEYKELVEEELLITQFYFMISSSFAVPSHIAGIVAKGMLQTRNVRYYSMTDFDVDSIILKKFYAANKNKFKKKTSELYTLVIFDETEYKKINKIKRMLKNQRFDEAVQQFGGKKISLLDDENKKYISLINQIQMSEYKIVEVKKNTPLLSAAGKNFAVRLEKFGTEYIPPFDEIESVVKSVYLKENSKAATLPRQFVWKQLSDMHFYAKYFGLPSQLLSKMFSAPLHQMQKFQFEDTTYFFIVDKVNVRGVTQDDIERADLYINSGMRDEIMMAVVNSLRLRYKIVNLMA